MRVGIIVNTWPQQRPAELADLVAELAADGFDSVWFSQHTSGESLTLAALVGSQVPGIEIGTGVVPTWPRHPVVMAEQAVTVDVITGGRFTLGIGVSHQPVAEPMFGISWDRPARHVREYLSMLMPLLAGEHVAFRGETLSGDATLDVAGRERRVPVLLGAMGPRMLDLAGGMADGTLPWMVGPKLLREYVVPRITAAAERAGRPAPRIAPTLQIAVTEDEAAVRESIEQRFGVVAGMPSYRRMAELGGVTGPADLALVGSEEQVAAQLGELESAGATDFIASVIDPETPMGRRTLAFLSEWRSGGR